NLMLNGIEAMRDTSGELTVTSTKTGDGQVLIAVSDSGVGIAPDGMLDEIRHAQLTLSFSHDLLKQAPQFDWANKAFHTNEWGIVAIRHFLDDTLLASSCVDSAVVTNLTLEHGFTNMQFVAFAAAAMDAGDVSFSNMLSSIQTDEARHSQQGFPTAEILARSDRKRAQQLLDASFWRSLRLFHLLT